MKASLQKKLQIQQIKFKEEQKKAQQVNREIQKKEMKESGGESHKNIILPKYLLNKDLNVYEEIDPPPKSLYIAVGYNDMERVKVIMEGDDAEKRSENNKRESKIQESAVNIASKSTVMRKDAMNNEMAAMEEENRVTKVTNLHYRKFYEDELENDKELFKRMPFFAYDIWRGQSRGAKKSSWFGGGDTDESG